MKTRTFRKAESMQIIRSIALNAYSVGHYYKAFSIQKMDFSAIAINEFKPQVFCVFNSECKTEVKNNIFDCLDYIEQVKTKEDFNHEHLGHIKINDHNLNANPVLRDILHIVKEKVHEYILSL